MLTGRGLRLTETEQRVPRDALRAPEVGRDFSAHLLGNNDALGHRVLAEEERPVGLGVIPGIRRLGPGIPSRGIRRAALCDVGLLDEPAVLVAPDFTIMDHSEALLGVLVDALQIVLELAEGGRPAGGDIIVVDIGRDIPLLHRVDNRLHMALAESDVVGRRRRAVRGQNDRVGGRAGRRRHIAQQARIELRMGIVIERLLGVVLENLLDDLANRVLTQIVELARIGDRISVFITMT